MHDNHSQKTRPSGHKEAAIGASQVMYHGEWYSIREGVFEILTALEPAVPQDLLGFTDADTGRALWLRAGDVEAILAGEEESEWPIGTEVLDELMVHALGARGLDRCRCERRWHRRLAPRHRGDY